MLLRRERLYADHVVASETQAYVPTLLSARKAVKHISNTMRSTATLTACFREIKRNHHIAVIERAARVVLGPSVLRVFAAGTAAHLWRALARTNVNDLRSFGSQLAFDRWFERELERIVGTIRRTKRGNARIVSGDKWGHASTLLSLLLREVVLNSRYFADRDFKRIQPWLHAPLDSVVLRHLRSSGVANAGKFRVKALPTAAP